MCEWFEQDTHPQELLDGWIQTEDRLRRASVESPVRINEWVIAKNTVVILKNALADLNASVKKTKEENDARRLQLYNKQPGLGFSIVT